MLITGHFHRIASLRVGFVFIVALVGCQTDDPTEPKSKSAGNDTANEAPAGTIKTNDNAEDSQRDVKELIEKLYAERNRPSNAPPTVPLPGRKSFIVNENGEITVVDLNYTPATNSDIERISKATSITSLGLAGTKITNEGLVFLKNLTKLKDLTLYATSVTDDGIADLSELKTLTNLRINTTHVTEEGMEALRGCLQTTELLV
jgi:hypothetical protein